MKILLINTSDSIGGAARAAYRLHKALCDIGLDSLLLVQRKEIDDCTVIGPTNKFKKGISLINPSLDQIPLFLYKKRKRNIPFSPAWLPSRYILNQLNNYKPDIVHLHCIHAGVLKINYLLRITVPIVWSLHDNWAFTGGCHIMWDCSKFKDICGMCPVLQSSHLNDLSRKIFLKKKNVFKRLTSLTIVGLSKWITECAKQSTLLKDKTVINLPNPINTAIYKPINRDLARNIFNLPQKKKLVLFGALSPIHDVNKGAKKLTSALQKISVRDIELVVFGTTNPSDQLNFHIPTHFLGKLYDDVSLTLLYNAVDVVVVPSIQENLSNTIMESLACGTPVVAFDTGGNSDMIDHKSNGYLAIPFHSDDLAKGLNWILTEADYLKLSTNARKKVTQYFDSTIVALRYKELYEKILLKK